VYDPEVRPESPRPSLFTLTCDYGDTKPNHVGVKFEKWQAELNLVDGVDDYGKAHWKVSMDGTGFAYMTQPPVEAPDLASQITWVPSTSAGAGGAGGAGGAEGAACDHEKDEAGCSTGYRCAINMKTTGTADDPKMQAMISGMTGMVEGMGSKCVAEAACDVATETGVAGVTMTVECSASYMVATVFSALALSYAI